MSVVDALVLFILRLRGDYMYVNVETQTAERKLFSPSSSKVDNTTTSQGTSVNSTDKEK